MKRGWSARLTICLLFGILWTCDREEPRLFSEPTPLVWKDPSGFPPMIIPPDNPLTEEGIALGRRLFYDPILSADSTVSCASCHLPELAFTDARAVSPGVHGARGTRSAMSLVNVGYYYSGLFWDGRVQTLEEQAFHPVRNPVEMAFNWSDAEARIRQHPEYPDLFRVAFRIREVEDIDSLLIAKALAQFERTLVSSNAKFDRVMAGAEQFTPQEKRGWTIFFDASPKDTPVSECNHCHVDPLFSDLQYQNNGVQAALNLKGFEDAGRGGVTQILYDNGKFRVPTLRNILLTAPYMHDGRFKTLDEVLNHYISGGHAAENLNPNVRPLHLNAQDRKDLMAFLRTLTDSTFIQNPAFRRPEG